MARIPHRLRIEITPSGKSWIEECREDPEMSSRAVSSFERLVQRVKAASPPLYQLELEEAMDQANRLMSEGL